MSRLRCLGLTQSSECADSAKPLTTHACFDRRKSEIMYANNIRYSLTRWANWTATPWCSSFVPFGNQWQRFWCCNKGKLGRVLPNLDIFAYCTCAWKRSLDQFPTPVAFPEQQLRNSLSAITSTWQWQIGKGLEQQPWRIIKAPPNASRNPKNYFHFFPLCQRKTLKRVWDRHYHHYVSIRKDITVLPC